MSIQKQAIPFKFIGLVLAVYAAAFAWTRLMPMLSGDLANVIAGAVTVDMVIGVPLVFYFLSVRPKQKSILTVMPLIGLGIAASRFLIPASNQSLLQLLTSALAPVEFGLLGYTVWRTAKAIGRARQATDIDILERFRQVTRDLIPMRLMADAIALELGVWYYAFASWVAKPHVPAGTKTFTHHIRSGYSSIVFGLALLLIGEGMAAHFLISRWCTLAAWIFTAGSVYTFVWLVADYRATVLRPILISGDSLELRAGLRWHARVPRAHVLSVGNVVPESVNEKDTLGITMFDVPTHWLHFSDPVTVRGPFWIQRKVLAVGLKPDSPDDFVKALDVLPDLSRPA